MDSEVAVAVLMEQVVRSAYRARRSGEVQPLQWTILRYLSLSPEQDRDLASIAAYAGVTPAPASRAVRTLEDRGFVQKERHLEDRRALSVRITRQGLEALENDPILEIANRLKELSEKEIDVISRALRKLALSEGRSG